MADKGLNPDGTIAREGSLDRVTTAFAPVVAAARTEITGRFGDGRLGGGRPGGGRLHSAYLYGSIPRGTAVPGTSDLDLMLVLHEEPAARDRADADAAEAALDGSFDAIDGAGILLVDTRAALSELERYDLGFFISCLCTPLLGDDLAARLPAQRPTSLLARETNGDLELTLPRWREALRNAGTDAGRRTLCRRIARRVVRSGFTLVMPRWGGWTSDLHESAELFAGHYPQRADQMRIAAAVARAPTSDPAVIRVLVEDLGPWLAAEYTAVHGRKAARP
ncbi:nucleotidyltransferase domain-containing protein [Streptomyces peucetius]|uniref:Nucleotidyltransferase domain-containing protein n=1 Tax=Streptomyces peucetius TaxID=1950 RepID=A0ABY6IEH6_STRPE|nr:nucleotidyltransferase domain-containing protein [Streptomyces peucetius]UYQ64354.1 nucleotidyltransferase domain-containing protein [Streptomyces peucetius]